MDEDKEIQILAKKTPVFTVLKNGSILKNIFLLRKPPPFSTEQSAIDTSSINKKSGEEILLVGRHPDCNITLEHPSISRYHLRIHSNPSSHKLSVVDLSSVHGTWVSGKRIEPGVRVKLKEGDTVKIGGSSRVYELHWVPLSQAFDVNDPFVPSTFRNQEETQDESCSYLETLDTNFSDEDLESSNLSFSNKNHHSSSKLNPLTFSPPNYLNPSCNDTDVQEHMTPSKTNNQNDEIFTTILFQYPFIVSETEISDTINISKDQLNSSSDNTINESDMIIHETIKDVPLSVPKFSESSIDDKTGNEDSESFNTVSIQTPVVVSESISEFNQMNQTNLTDESDSMVLCTSFISKDVDTGVKFESVDNKIMKKESVFLDLLDETDMDQERSFTPEISRTKEVSRNLLDSLDGNELEFFTPDKENKDPNACLMKSLRKRWKEDENKESNNCIMLKEDVSTTVNEGKKDIFDLSDYDDEVLFSSEKETESRLMKMEESGNSINCPQIAQKVIDSSNGFTKKRWTMVLDTNTLLHNESLKHLKLLQGLKGTQLFIPKIVLKELKDIKDQQNLSNRTTKKVSLALKWIEECMITTKWWIQIEDEIETESKKVLETAIHLCKEIKDGKIIILSDDISLKIKSMKEGIMCEEAEEFFRSLVNPFSERFMWVGSLARGLTWSCLDDDYVLREKYEGFGFNVSNRFKGLKLLACMTIL